MKLVDVPERHLPPDFADRLVGLVRRRKRIRRLRVAVVLVASAGILGTGLVGGFCCRERENGRLSTETRLVATGPVQTNDTQVTGLLMLGFFRGCFRRNKTGERREED